MKKLLISLALLLGAAAATAQHANPDKIYVYGVDFSQVKVYGTTETDAQFAEAFNGINSLLEGEPGKYDFGKAFGKPVFVDTAPVAHNNAGRDYASMRTDPSETVGEETVAALVKGYELPRQEGTGVVLIAKLLDKAKNRGTYDVVFFDIATRKIILTQEMSAKAGGFGLRNFWAHTVYGVIKDWKRK